MCGCDHSPNVAPSYKSDPLPVQIRRGNATRHFPNTNASRYVMPMYTPATTLRSERIDNDAWAEAVRPVLEMPTLRLRRRFAQRPSRIFR